MVLDSELKDILIKLSISLLIGLVIGAEREYRNKSAGLRTIILICLGSTVFTIISMKVSHETEVARIASNIVTGIGFLGAGAIMRDGLSISGLTTASTIWVAAALGMAVGAGEFITAGIGTVLVLVVLTVFSKLQLVFDRLRRSMDLHIIFNVNQNGVEELEQKMYSLNISFDRKKESRKQEDVKYHYELTGKAKKLESLISYLIQQNEKR